MKEIVNFKTSARIKGILGSGLIHDDIVAIVELIKNSKDANSNRCYIIFDKEKTISNDSTLIIADDGIGMSKRDIIEKWLNVAYSDKRDKIKNSNGDYYAGNKGVGRFSCDRLGSELILYTHRSRGEYLKLIIDWDKFETNQGDIQIQDIPLEMEELSRSDFLDEINYPKFLTGTVLMVNKLRKEWDLKCFRKLVDELEKFSPSLNDNFDVFLYSKQDFQTDEILSQKINKKIENNILRKIKFKTTYIRSAISSDGRYITVELFFQGKIVYKYKAYNPYDNLKDIRVEIHYLDTLSKAYFTRNFKVKPNDYGSVFLFYNNFRISPYGNPKNDWLNLDQRKTQGSTRNFGTRDLVGKIEIIDNESNFSVLSSREGLANNKSFTELIGDDGSRRKWSSYIIEVIDQLEKFVVRGLDWNRLVDKRSPDKRSPIRVEQVLKDHMNYSVRPINVENVQKSCKSIIKGLWWSILDDTLVFNDELLDKISNDSIAKYNKFINDFITSIKDETLLDLDKIKKKKAVEIINKEIEKRKKAEEKQKIIEKENAEINKKLIASEKSRLFSEVQTLSSDRFIGYIHQLGLISDSIVKDLNYIIKKSRKQTLSVDYCIEQITEALYNTQKINAVCNFATKANFDIITNKLTIDVAQFFNDYLEKVKASELGLRYEISYRREHKPLIKTIFPIEITIVIDNILNNALKANASKIWINISVEEHFLQILFINDGEPLTDKFTNEDLLKKGVTTTKGSGIGLFHSNSIIEELGGVLKVYSDKDSNLTTVEIKIAR